MPPPAQYNKKHQLFHVKFCTGNRTISVVFIAKVASIIVYPRAHTGQGIPVEGTAVGLDPSGALVIETDQGERIQVISVHYGS
ncbi:hypothetical protein [Paenibacillus polymyxa]|uniref:hypothetical protein n=1 Tax=Paenibacillus polymyxa TaxID=1406 RepID=UPI0003D32D39|nr:hypothetical protein [Paenibacillus polymyxa]AIW40435.1 hypothetical protein X809_30855 [Paenibacillus polymyxa CR1]